MKHAASVHPEPGSNSPLSEKFMSLVHLSMNRSTSFYFVRFIFSKSTGIYRLQLFYCQCSISSQNYSVTRLRSSISFLIPFKFLSHSLPFATSSILSPQFCLSTSFFKFFRTYFFSRSFGLLITFLKNH